MNGARARVIVGVAIGLTVAAMNITRAGALPQLTLYGLPAPVPAVPAVGPVAITSGLSATYVPSDRAWKVDIPKITVAGAFSVLRDCSDPEANCPSGPTIENNGGFIGTAVITGFTMEVTCAGTCSSLTSLITGTSPAVTASFTGRDLNGREITSGSCGAPVSRDFQGVVTLTMSPYRTVSMSGLTCYTHSGFFEVPLLLTPGPFTRAPNWKTPPQVGVVCSDDVVCPAI